MQENFEKKIHDTKVEYDSLFTKISDEKKLSEKIVLQKFNDSQIKQKQLSQEITNIRERHSNLEDEIFSDKIRTLKIIQEKHVGDLNDFVRNYQHDSDLKIVWNSGVPTFEIS